MRNNFNSCNYSNECCTLNANIPRSFSPNSSPIRHLTILSLTELLCFNINQVIILEYDTSTIKGVLEYVGDTYIIIHDLKVQTKTLYFINQIRSITFCDDIRYTK